MPMHIDLRPKDFTDIFGNEGTVEALDTLLARGEDLPHAYLFYGPAGTGKTTLARILKEKLEVDDADFYELNVANLRGIDHIRKVIDKAKFASVSGGKKFFLFDEVHQVTGDAQEAMLKLLEDPPSHVYIALATTNPEKLKKTTRSRCTTFRTDPLRKKDMRALLRHALDKTFEEGAGEDFPKEAIELIVKKADGCARDALVILDQVAEIEDDDKLLKAIDQAGTETPEEASVSELAKHLMDTNVSADVRWKQITPLLKEFNGNPESLRRGLIGYFNAVMLNTKSVKKALFFAELIEAFEDNYYDSGKAGLSKSCVLALGG